MTQLCLGELKFHRQKHFRWLQDRFLNFVVYQNHPETLKKGQFLKFPPDLPNQCFNEGNRESTRIYPNSFPAARGRPLQGWWGRAGS